MTHDLPILILSAVMVFVTGLALCGLVLFIEPMPRRFHLTGRRTIGLGLMTASALIFVAAVTVLS